ncbi:MAG: sulfatase [Kiritimatiellae bacterium]|nr:sulfatase [Kiritimatiellia bacterium]
MKKQTKQDQRLNVVLMVSDDHGLDAGCYGNHVVKTPHLDALAEDGTKFSHAFCTASTCSPSRAVILTGLHNHANGQYGLTHKHHHFASFDNIKSLPAFLNDMGYRTARAGKYHVAPESVYHFDKTLFEGSRNTVEMSEACRSFIDSDDAKPFFLYYCPYDSHRSFDYADELPYKPNRFGNEPDGFPGVETTTYNPEDVLIPSCLPDTPECRAELAQYYQSISRMDQGIGRLIKILKETGQYDNTLIIYISDNGCAFPEAKTTLYDSGLRLPCIVRSPIHKQRGATCNAMISWADITPTILDFAEAGTEDTSFHGRSFKTIIDEENPDGWDEIYASHTFHEVTMYYPMRVIRTRRYKFIWNLASTLEYPFATDLWDSPTWQGAKQKNMEVFGARTVDAFLHRSRFELYDLEVDPNETVNLAEDPQYESLIAGFKKKLKAFQEQTNDPWIIKWYRE